MPAARLTRRGPPLGNQNARKHGFYSSTLSPAQQALLPRAKKIRSLNDEIGIARVRFAAAVADSSTNARVLSAATNSLLRLERTRQASLSRRRTADSRAAKLRRTGTPPVNHSIPTTARQLHERERRCA